MHPKNNEPNALACAVFYWHSKLALVPATAQAEARDSFSLGNQRYAIRSALRLRCLRRFSFSNELFDRTEGVMSEQMAQVGDGM